MLLSIHKTQQMYLSYVLILTSMITFADGLTKCLISCVIRLLLQGAKHGRQSLTTDLSLRSYRCYTSEHHHLISIRRDLST